MRPCDTCGGPPAETCSLCGLVRCEACANLHRVSPGCHSFEFFKTQVERQGFAAVDRGKDHWQAGPAPLPRSKHWPRYTTVVSWWPRSRRRTAFVHEAHKRQAGARLVDVLTFAVTYVDRAAFVPANPPPPTLVEQAAAAEARFRAHHLGTFEHVEPVDLHEATLQRMPKTYDSPCIVCDGTPTVGDTGLCGPCCFGEAETVNGNW